MGNYGKALETFASFGDICYKEQIVPFFVGDLDKICDFFNQEFKILKEATEGVFSSCIISKNQLLYKNDSLYCVSKDAKFTVEALLERKLSSSSIKRGEIFYANFLCDEYGNFNEKTFLLE